MESETRSPGPSTSKNVFQHRSSSIGWIEATGAVDPKNFPTDITMKDPRGVWERVKRPFANIEGGGDVSWTMFFPIDLEMEYNNFRNREWRTMLILLTSYWMFSILVFEIFSELVEDDPVIFRYTFVGEMICCMALLFCLWREYFPLLHLGSLLGISIVATTIVYHATNTGASEAIFLVSLLIYCGLPCLSLFVCFFLVMVCVCGFLIIDGFWLQDCTGQYSWTIILSTVIFYFMILIFGLSYAYVLHFNLRHGYLKTLSFARNERGKYFLFLFFLSFFLSFFFFSY